MAAEAGRKGKRKDADMPSGVKEKRTKAEKDSQDEIGDALSRYISTYIAFEVISNDNPCRIAVSSIYDLRTSKILLHDHIVRG
jgi:hypothetical protein